MVIHNRLFVFVEGFDDKYFFENIIRPFFKRKYRNEIYPIKYAETASEVICSRLNEIKSVSANYIFFSDINNAPCKSARKDKLKEIYSEQQTKDTVLENKNIILVIKKIEGWYLAGLDKSTCGKMGIKQFDNTDDFGKGKFKEHTPVHFKHARKDFLVEIVKCYSIETAKSKNQSFKYFVCEKGTKCSFFRLFATILGALRSGY